MNSTRFCPILLVLLAAAAGCRTSFQPDVLARLEPCTSEQGPGDAFCGTLSVFEDRAAKAGRRIALNIVVIPAIGADVLPDPFVFLAGGPGQGAAQMASQIRPVFRKILRNRDIVLVDQRGTGQSHPLDCRAEGNTLSELTEPDEAALERLRQCLEGFDADLRLYTTSIAMDDLDDVRSYLGYSRLNLYGGSYGTRAALVYLRQHPGRVRAMVLDGVSPTDMRIPLFAARDAQRALDKLLGDCAADAGCNAAYPRLGERVHALLARLETAPASVRVVHPRTGVAEDVTVEARTVASILFGALYNPVTASMVPVLIDRAEQHQFESLFALGLAGGDTIDDNMAIGMQLSVLCSEDAPRYTLEDLTRAASGSIFSVHLARGQRKACEIWPRGTVDPSFYDPVVSEVPALILSGDVDPVTPPGWGEAVARHLPNARHVAVPATGHGVVATPCGAQLIEAFIDRGNADDLDTSCVETVRRPSFFITLAGPDPAAGHTPAVP